MRTQMLVASASCLIMLISITIAGARGDPGRIAAQVVTGIGFLGAGAIIRFGLTIRGLTTAASIWASAAIGLAVGAGYLVGALGLTVLVVAALLVFDPLEAWLTGDWEIRKIVIRASDVPELTGAVESLVKKYSMQTREMGITRDLKEKTVEVELSVLCRRETNFPSLLQEMSQIQGVTRVQID
jgi:putative Mg2+ transporter-C (MgtC) family protein